MERDCDGGGNAGRRLGGLAADTWGLNVTLRGGFVVDVGRGDDGDGRRGVRSVDGVVEAMSVLFGVSRRCNWQREWFAGWGCAFT